MTHHDRVFRSNDVSVLCNGGLGIALCRRTHQERVNRRPIGPLSLLRAIKSSQLHPARDRWVGARVHEQCGHAKRASAGAFPQGSIPDAGLVVSIHVGAVLEEILRDFEVFLLHRIVQGGLPQAVERVDVATVSEKLLNFVEIAVLRSKMQRLFAEGILFAVRIHA